MKQQLSRFFEKLSAEAAADPLCGLRRPGADGRDVLVASESSPRIIPSGQMERSGRTCTSSKALLNSHQWCELACPEEGDRTLRISKFLHRRNCHRQLSCSWDSWSLWSQVCQRVGHRTSGHKRTPLHLAAKFDTNAALPKALVEAGADVNANNVDQFTPLHVGTRYNDVNVVKALIDKNASSSCCNEQSSCAFNPAISMQMSKREYEKSHRPLVV